MAPDLFTLVTSILGVGCLLWGLLAVLFPRYSVLGSLSPVQQVEEVDDDAVRAHDPVTWRGMGREDATFTVGEQRRAGVMVGATGLVLLWIAMV
ncbi:MAG: hypothetical protein ABEJ57_09035 [Halobacteriaceae archaeon]